MFKNLGEDAASKGYQMNAPLLGNVQSEEGTTLRPGSHNTANSQIGPGQVRREGVGLSDQGVSREGSEDAERQTKDLLPDQGRAQDAL